MCAIHDGQDKWPLPRALVSIALTTLPAITRVFQHADDAVRVSLTTIMKHQTSHHSSCAKRWWEGKITPSGTNSEKLMVNPSFTWVVKLCNKCVRRTEGTRIQHSLPKPVPPTPSFPTHSALLLLVLVQHSQCYFLAHLTSDWRGKVLTGEREIARSRIREHVSA